MLDRIINSFENFSDRNAFCIEDKYFTYANVQDLVLGIMSEIKTQCPPEEKIIGIVANNDIYTYASILALWFSGKGYLPVLPGMPEERNLNIIHQAGVKTLMTAAPEKLPVAHTSVEKIIDTTINYGHLDCTIEAHQNPESLAYLLFTSGSTGVPKGVPITFANLDVFVTGFFEAGYFVSEHDRFLQMFDLTFDLSVISYLIPLCKGACVYTVSENGMKYMNVYSLLEDKQISFAMMVPSVISFLRSYFEDIHLPEMKYSLFCGEALYVDIIQEWKNCIPHAEIHNVYGPTETTVFCMTYFADFNSEIKSNHGIVCIGRPMKNIEIIICDEKGTPVKTHTKGEICIGGPSVMSGYWNDPVKTESSFFITDTEEGHKLYYRTGDIAFVDDDGNYFFCGRLDNQVKIQGYRVELAEIEFAARKHVSDKNVAAITHQDENGNHEIYLYVENFSDNVETLRDALKEFLPHYMLPKEIIGCKQFPLNSNGKTDRKLLKKWIQT